MGLFSKKIQFSAPVAGQILPLSEVNDDVFASGMMGKGFAVEPTNGDIYSPVTGSVTQLFPTKHAFGLKVGKLEVLVHLGIDTVELNGKPFTELVQVGDQVTPETQLGTMDLDQVKSAGKVATVMVIVTNSKDALKSFEITTRGEVKPQMVIAEGK